MKPTPGPWTVLNRAGSGYGKEFDIGTSKGRAFKGNQLDPAGISIAEARANAELAAAAPELIEALREAAGAIEYAGRENAPQRIARRARALLSRLGAE